MHAKVNLHPIVFGDERADLEHLLATDHIDEEARSGLDIGHSESNMIAARQTRQPTGHRFDTGSQVMVIRRSFCSSKTLSRTSANFFRWGSSMCLFHSARLTQFS